MPSRNRTPDWPVQHPVAAGVILVVTGALVVAVITGLARGLASLE